METGAIHETRSVGIGEDRGRILGNIAIVIVEHDLRLDAGGVKRGTEVVLDEGGLSGACITRLGVFFGFSGSFCTVMASIAMPSAFMACTYFTK